MSTDQRSHVVARLLRLLPIAHAAMMPPKNMRPKPLLYNPKADNATRSVIAVESAATIRKAVALTAAGSLRQTSRTSRGTPTPSMVRRRAAFGVQNDAYI